MFKVSQESDTPCVIEQNKRLSDSILWRLQRSYFETRGIDAWRQGTVPHYITSNPFIADAYVQIVTGFLRDYIYDSYFPNSNQPIYIVELGAGPGRFAHHFLKRFHDIHRKSALKDITVRYVMTDLASRTIEYWQAHPWLRPFVENGELDFARFDAVSDTQLKLAHSGEMLSAGTVTNPLIVLANYFFDGIPQDAFYIEGGCLYESLISVAATDNIPDLADPELLNHIKTSFENRPVNGNYYDDPACNHILHEYSQQLNDTFLVFPHAAINCIRRLGKLSNGCLLLLTADKGYNQEESLQKRGQPGISLHGSFSMMVNYHAISKYISKMGGQVIHTTRHHNSLDVSAYIVGKSSENSVETRLACNTTIKQFGPDDFFTLKKGIENTYDTLTVPQIIAYLRLSRWDANIFLGCFPTLLDRVDALDQTERQELLETIRNVWEMYYPIGEERDLAFNMGMLLYGMEYYEDALYYFKQSLELNGENASTFYNIGMCYYCQGNLDSALVYVNKAIELEPAIEVTAEICTDIQEKTEDETRTPVLTI